MQSNHSSKSRKHAYSSAVYKSKHNIGSRRAARNVGPYNQPIWYTGGLGTTTSKLEKTFLVECGSKDKPGSETQDCFSSVGDTCHINMNKTKKLPQTKEKKSGNLKSTSAVKGSKKEAKNAGSGKNSSTCKSEKKAPEKKVTEKKAEAVKKGKKKTWIPPRPVHFRREACLNAIAKNNVMFCREESSSPVKMQGLINGKTASKSEKNVNNKEEVKGVSTAGFYKNKKQNSPEKTEVATEKEQNNTNKVKSRKRKSSEEKTDIKQIKHQKLAKNVKKIQPDNTKKKDNTSKKNKNKLKVKFPCQVKKVNVTLGDTKSSVKPLKKQRKAGSKSVQLKTVSSDSEDESGRKGVKRKIISRGDWESWRHSKRMASLNAQAILAASCAPEEKKMKPQKQPSKQKEKADVQKKEKSAKKKEKKEIVSKEGTKKDLKRDLQVIAPKLDIKPSISYAVTQFNSVHRPSQTVVQQRPQNVQSQHRTMTSLPPSTLPTTFRIEDAHIQPKPNEMPTKPTVLQPRAISGSAHMIGNYLLDPMNRVTNPQGAQPQCLPGTLQGACAYSPIVPTTQCQQLTLGGLGSISNIPLMYHDPYRSAFSVPTYNHPPLPVYQHGFYQPAGPLIQSLPEQCVIAPHIPIPISAAHDIKPQIIQPDISIIKREPEQKFPVKRSRQSANHGCSVSMPKVEVKETKVNLPLKSKPKTENKTTTNKDKVKKKEVEKKKAKQTQKKEVKVEKKEIKVEETEKKKVKKKLDRFCGWSWFGEPEMKPVMSLDDSPPVERKCYQAIKHVDGDIIRVRDCVLLRSGPRKNDLPYIAKVAAFWENKEDGEMMMTLLWYYRPEHTENCNLPRTVPQEIFASKHRDENSVACIDDKCYVLTFAEYCRYRCHQTRALQGLPAQQSIVPEPEDIPLSCYRKAPFGTDPTCVFLCRFVYDFRQKRILKNPS